jgi:hypothetical protein
MDLITRLVVSVETEFIINEAINIDVQFIDNGDVGHGARSWAITTTARPTSTPGLPGFSYPPSH